MTLQDALDVIVLLSRALDEAHVELVQLDELPVPLPVGVLKKLREGEAMAATFRRLPEDARAALRVPYREEWEKATTSYEGGRVPVSSGVLASLAEVDEIMRRCALFDSQLDDARAGWSLRRVAA